MAGRKAGNKSVLAVVVVLAALSIVSFAVYSFLFTADTGPLKESVKGLYELANPGATAEVVSLSEESGLYKVGLKVTGASGTSYIESWVTRDGRLLVQNVIYVKESLGQMQKAKAFVDCLRLRGLKIYGVLNQTTSPQGALATYQQLNALGLYSSKLYVDCDASLQACLGANVSYVPSVVFNGKVESGLKDIPALENITGCRMG